MLIAISNYPDPIARAKLKIFANKQINKLFFERIISATQQGFS